MKVSNKFGTVKSEWSIVYNEGSRWLSPKLCCISFSEDRYGISDRASPMKCHLMRILFGYSLFAKVSVVSGIQTVTI